MYLFKREPDVSFETLYAANRRRQLVPSKATPGTITITGWVNNTGTDLSGYATINVAVYDLTTRALVYLATGLTVVSGDVSFSHSSIVAGTTYRVLADQDGNTTDLGCARVLAT